MYENVWNHVKNTHNQGVPGSSPGGATTIEKATSFKVWLFYFMKLHCQRPTGREVYPDEATIGADIGKPRWAHLRPPKSRLLVGTTAGFYSKKL